MAESTSNKSNANTSSEKEPEPKPAFLHDFLGRNLLPAPVKAASGNDPSLAISDLGSDKQVMKHLEGVPFYGPGSGSDLTGSEMSNRSAGNKRNISDSVFMGSPRDGFPPIRAESSEGLHLMKMLRNAGTERPRRAHEEGMFFGMNPLGPTSSTPHLLGPPSGRSDPSGLRWDRAIPLNMGPTLQHAPPRMGQISPFSIHTPANKYKDGSIGPSGISQSAADEGSRTGIKRSGFFSSINGDVGVLDRVPSAVLMSGNVKNFGKPICEPESSASASRQELAPGSRQMTIFYGGQAHVFDDVHPNKAEVIMSVAGSNGGSWSTSYAKSAIPGTSESFKPHEAGAASKHVTPGELRRDLSIAGSNTRGFGPGYQISVPSVAGGHQESTMMNVEHGENVGKMGTVQKREV